MKKSRNFLVWQMATGYLVRQDILSKYEKYFSSRHPVFSSHYVEQGTSQCLSQLRNMVSTFFLASSQHGQAYKTGQQSQNTNNIDDSLQKYWVQKRKQSHWSRKVIYGFSGSEPELQCMSFSYQCGGLMLPLAYICSCLFLYLYLSSCYECPFTFESKSWLMAHFNLNLPPICPCICTNGTRRPLHIHFSTGNAGKCPILYLFFNSF